MKNRILLALFTFIAVESYGQFRLPSFDIALKGGYMFVDDPTEDQHADWRYESLFLQGELNVHIGQHVAVGYFHQRNMFVTNYHGDDAGLDRPGKHLLQGLNVRLSTGRSAKWRPYLNIKYFKLEALVEYDGFNLAYDGMGYGLGVGVMLRLSHNLYLNVVELDANSLPNEGDMLFRETKTVFPQFRTGVTYNFSKRK